MQVEEEEDDKAEKSSVKKKKKKKKDEVFLFWVYKFSFLDHFQILNLPIVSSECH